MKETKFIEQNKEKWAEFEDMLRENRHDPEKLNDLFIQITDDLSYARTFYPNRSVRIYLNTLAQRVFHNVYRGKRFPAERLRRFWTDELPQLFWEERRALMLSFSLFVLAFSIGVVSSMINPDFARIILGDGYVDMTIQNIEKGDPMAVYKDGGPFGMSITIAGRNLFVAFQTAILGVLASLGSVFILLYNGIMVGVFQYFFVEKGVFWQSFLTIWIHGTLEISTIIVAGTAGLVAGSGLLFPGTYTRGQAFQISMRRGLKIFFGIVPLILLAAFFESFFTRYTDTPAILRGTFILTSLAFVVWYFVWLPRHKAKTGTFREPLRDKELPPDKEQIVDFNAIKSAGEILSDTFSVLRRHPKITILGLVVTTALFGVFAFGFSSKPPSETFVFTDIPYWPFDIMIGAGQLFGEETVPLLYYFQILLLCGLAVAAFRALELEMDTEERPLFSRQSMLLAALPLLLPMPCFIGLLKMSTGGIISMIAYPFLALWSAVIYFETRNPFTALSRAFRLMRWGQGILIGFLLVILSMLLFVFIEFPVWDRTLGLFSWLIPGTEGAMDTFIMIATACAAVMILYFIFMLMMIGGALQYFSGREVADATKLFEEIETIGTARQIRGIARE